MEKSIPTINHFVAYLKLKKLFPDDLEFLENIGELIIKRLDLTVVDKSYHKFSPAGITLVYILAQSHLILHTWPEHHLLHLDLFSCIELSKEELAESIKTAIPGEGIENLIVERIKNLM